jgi:glutathione S-transferase
MTMSQSGLYRIFGGLGSPYSMKMRAILRYRRLPHTWIQMGEGQEDARHHVKVPVIPVIQYPDGSYHNDSTPMIYQLEERHKATRSIVPESEGDAFLAALLEDMADEWGTKLMFHYRWFRARDQEQMSDWLSFDRLRGRKSIHDQAKVFRDRQVGRMALVGCTEENQALIEESGRRIFASFEKHVTEKWFFFGSRPSLAEFGWFGQMSQLIVDPTPDELFRITAPFTVRWLMQMDDLSGIEGAWREGSHLQIVEDLLALAGEVYFPFLLANANAVARGSETFSFTALGQPYSQGVFKYQAKCLETLRSAYRALSGAARDRIDPVLERNGCCAPLAA